MKTAINKKNPDTCFWWEWDTCHASSELRASLYQLVLKFKKFFLWKASLSYHNPRLTATRGYIDRWWHHWLVILLDLQSPTFPDFLLSCGSFSESFSESLFPIGPGFKLLIPIGPPQLPECCLPHSRSFENPRARKNFFRGSQICFACIPEVCWSVAENV